MALEEAFEVDIRALGTDGQGIGTLPSGKICFVEGVFPEETCLVRIISESSKFANCEAISVIRTSPSRVRAFEPVKDLSGGLPLASLSYEAQLEYKASKVRDCLARVGRISEEELSSVMKPIVPCDRPGRYRNHMQYAVKDNRVGLLAAGSDRLGAYDEELIEYEIFSRLRRAAEACFERAPTTLFSGLVMRGSERTGEVLVEFVSSLSASHEIVIRDCSSYLDASGMTSGFERVCEEAGFALNGVLLRISPDKTSKRTRSGKRAVIRGVDHYDEIFCGRRLRVKAGSFFQVNTEQAEKLAGLVSEWINDANVFYDLYCGAGTLGIAVKREGQKVFGVESVPEAVESAKINRSLAFPDGGADELSFLCRDVLKTDLAGMIKAGKIEAPDAVIVDPPRKGLDAGVIVKIEELAPAKIAYVSCDPATLARDLRMLTRKYRITSVTPVDLFANAAHVECVVLMLRKNT